MRSFSMLHGRLYIRRFVQLVFGCSLLFLAACGEKEQQTAGQAVQVPVRVVEVKPTSAPLYIDLPGRADAIRDAEVRARVTGIVTEIHFEQGSDVDKGELLFTIDPARSEEHTSELQSRGHLVCRLLLEIKN